MKLLLFFPLRAVLYSRIKLFQCSNFLVNIFSLKKNNIILFQLPSHIRAV